MRLDRLDLNLLVALDALLAESSVTVAANRLHLSQSATSSALGRLRAYFGDRLLVGQGRHMILTDRARGLIGPVRQVLDQISETLIMPARLDPGECDKTIRIMATDYAVTAFLAEKLLHLVSAAPLLRFDIVPLSDDPALSLARSQIDLLLLPATAASAQHPHQRLFEDRFVVLGCARNPALHGAMSEELYRRLGHVAASSSKMLNEALCTDLRDFGGRRRVDVIGPSYLSLPALVADTHRIATIPNRLAMIMAVHRHFVIHELPFPASPIRYVAQWNGSHGDDAILRFVLKCIAPSYARDQVPELQPASHQGQPGAKPHHAHPAGTGPDGHGQT